MDKLHAKSLSRRSFLKLAGAVSLAGIAVSCAPAPATQPAKPAEQPEVEEVKATEAPISNPAPAKQITIRFGRHDAVEGDAENVQIFEQQHPNIKVEQEMIGEFATKVPAMAAAGNLPDVFRSWEAMCLDLARNGQIIDLQPNIDADKEFKPEDFYESWYNYPMVTGKRYGVPDVAAPHVTFYNAELFEQRGVEFPKKDSFTWSDFETKARAVSDVENKIWGSETIPVGWSYFTLKQVWQNGGDFFTPDYKECIISNPEAVEAIQYWADLMLSGEVMPTPSQIASIGGENVAAELMTAGKLGMQRMGVWIVNNLVQAGFKWNIVPEPSKGRQDTITHGAFSTIPMTTQEKEAAWLWLNFRCSTDGIYNYSKVGKFPGTRKSSNLKTPHPWVVDDLDYEVDWEVIPNALTYGHVLPGPANEGEALKVIGDALQKIYAGEVKAADVLPGITDQVTDILSE